MLEEEEWRPFWSHTEFSYFLKQRGFEGLSDADVKAMADELRELRKRKFPRPTAFPVLLQVSLRRYVVVEVKVPDPAGMIHRYGGRRLRPR
jgi:hypothetical protein